MRHSLRPQSCHPAANAAMPTWLALHPAGGGGSCGGLLCSLTYGLAFEACLGLFGFPPVQGLAQACIDPGGKSKSGMGLGFGGCCGRQTCSLPKPDLPTVPLCCLHIPSTPPPSALPTPSRLPCYLTWISWPSWSTCMQGKAQVSPLALWHVQLCILLEYVL